MFKQTILRICDIAIEGAFYVLLVAAAFSNSFVEIAATVMIAAWFLKRAIDRDFSSVPLIPAALVLLFWLWGGLSCFNSGYSKESFRGMFKIFEEGLLFIAAASELRKEACVKRFLRVLSIGAVFISINGFYQYFSGTDLLRHRQLQPDEALRRISSSFVHPNDFGVYLLVVCVVLISVITSRASSLRSKAAPFFALIVSGLAFFLTRSRGAFLSFGAAVLALGATKSRRLVVFFATLLVAGLFVMPVSERERIISVADITKGTTWERLELWEGTINMIKVHPVLGFGINTYSRNFPNYKPAGYPDVRYSHNCYLHMASEIGIPGAAIFLGFLSYVLFMAFRGASRMESGLRKSTAQGLAAALLGFAINSAVDTHFYSVTLSAFFYVLLGYCSALTAHGKTD